MDMKVQQKQRRLCGWHSSSNCWLLMSSYLIMMLITMDMVESALRNVSLIVDPPTPDRGQHVVLRCVYDLKGAPLYSTKFYRGQLEFYRYTPGEFPNTKVFPFPGIHVDVTSSDATQVLLRNVGFGLSGNFSCEVTTDAPFFSTATAHGAMQVVELPQKRPQLYTEHTRYEPGDVLRANCSTEPSRPRVELKFTINNMVITNAETQFLRTVDNLIASRISLKLQLQGVHFSSVNPAIYNSGYDTNSVYNHGAPMYAPNPGGLLLRCSAQIAGLYQEYKEIELGTPQRDPVPARVTHSSSSSMKNFFSTFWPTSAASATLRPAGNHMMAPIIMALIVLLIGGSRLLGAPAREQLQQPHSRPMAQRLSTLSYLQGNEAAAAGLASSQMRRLGQPLIATN
ncbi:beat-IIa [Drosophila busckii]|uniref:Beat-IIa n=2 Tax=Drosophila busckii TaxID=30019 RepID=A0A0M4F3Q8_DROBS|nr:beat-IIa [Drosophila busckii]